MKPPENLNTTEGPNLAKLLESESGGVFAPRRRWVIGVVVLVTAAVAAVLVLRPGDRSTGPRYTGPAPDARDSTLPEAVQAAREDHR